MIANLILPNVNAYDIEKFDLRLGVTCKLEIETDKPFEWFFNNDEVLSLIVDNNTAKIKATKEGNCQIQLQNDGKILKYLNVTVFSTETVSLNIQVGAPELK